MISKLHLLFIALLLALLQLSCCAVIRGGVPTDPIERYRYFLLSIPNVKETHVDKFIDLVKNVMSSSASSRNEAILAMLFSGTNVSKDEQTEMVNLNAYRTDEMTIERLNTRLTSNEANKIVSLLRKLDMARTQDQLVDVAIDLMVHAIPAQLNIPDNFVTKQTLINFQKRKIDVFQNQYESTRSRDAATSGVGWITRTYTILVPVIITCFQHFRDRNQK